MRTILFKKKIDHIPNKQLYNTLKLQNFEQILATRILVDFTYYEKPSINHNSTMVLETKQTITYWEHTIELIKAKKHSLI